MSFGHRALLLTSAAIVVFSCASCDGPDIVSLWVPQAQVPAVPVPVESPGFAASPEGLGQQADPVLADGKLTIGVAEAALLALQHNPAFLVERFGPAIEHTYEVQERAAFDPALAAEISVLREEDAAETEAGATSTDLHTSGTTRSGAVGLEQVLPTGTAIQFTAGRDLQNLRGDPENDSNYDDLSATSRWDLTVTQALLEGAGPAVNLARVRQARLDTRISRWVLEGAAETLVYQTEATGWDYLLARRQIEIYEESLRLAEEQLAEVRERIAVGALADFEIAAVEAEVAQRREGLINARSLLAMTRLEFLRLLGLGGQQAWERELDLTDAPVPPTDPLAPLEQHVELALKQRPDLNEARLRIQRRELEIVRTRNGLLPRLDFFVTLGGTRYADSFGSTGRDRDGDTTDVETGLRLEYALGQRSQRAAYDRSLFVLKQAQEALRNQEDLAQVDVRTAYLEVQRTAEQIEATAATRRHREETLRAETEKFRVGKSTSLLVAQAQRDLVESRIAEVEALVQHLKARLNLYLQEGSLLERRGIQLGD